MVLLLEVEELESLLELAESEEDTEEDEDLAGELLVLEVLTYYLLDTELSFVVELSGCF